MVREHQPDGTLIAWGQPSNAVVHLMDGRCGQAFGPPLCLDDGEPVFSLDFSPDGNLLAVARGDGSCALWNLNLQAWLDLAREIVNRNFTPEEWRRYFGETPYRRTIPNLAPPDADRE
jgi:WD40 repeat protein